MLPRNTSRPDSRERQDTELPRGRGTLHKRTIFCARQDYRLPSGREIVTWLSLAPGARDWARCAVDVTLLIY